MSEDKRFVDYFDKEHNYIIQDLQNEDEYQVGYVNCDEDKFLELINELAEENEQLKSDNKGLSNEILEISNLIADIAEEDLTESQRTLINRICKVVFK